MSRKKPRKVDEVNYRKLGVTIDIMMDPDNLTFFARVAGETLSNPNACRLKVAVIQKLTEVIGLTWIPVIEVKEAHIWAMGMEAAVGFVLNRFYVAQKVNGFWVKCRWEIPADWKDSSNRLSYSEDFYWLPSHGEFSLPCSHPESQSGRVYYLPYTDETWAGLEQMQEAIKQLKVKLREMLSSTEGTQHLARIGANILRALPAPEEKGSLAR